MSTPTDHLTDGARIMGICNSCRYCEAYCAVFVAMERRTAFERADMTALANLCHNCGECLYACQYAPPHEFAVNVPLAMARVRRRTYAAHAWPAALGRAYERNGLVLSLALAAGLALFLALATALHGGLDAAPGASFYDVFPHGLLVALFAPVLGAKLALLTLAATLRVATPLVTLGRRSRRLLLTWLKSRILRLTSRLLSTSFCPPRPVLSFTASIWPRTAWG